MNALINRENMKLLHVHKDSNLLCNLAWIECHYAAYYVLSLQDATSLKVFTSMELQMLYHNITGSDGVKFNRSQLIQIIWDLCNRVKESNVDPIEADAQAEYIKENNPDKWIYVKGAMRPGKKSDLFEHKACRARVSTVEEDMARTGWLPALKPVMGAPTIPPRTTPNPRSTPATPKRTAKQGSAKAVIWGEADRMWAEIGSPNDKSAIMALRKQILEHLIVTETTIKRGTVSAQLSSWHKTRVPY